MRDGGLEFLLRDAPAATECASVHAWWPRQVALGARHPSPIVSTARAQRIERAWERIAENRPG